MLFKQNREQKTIQNILVLQDIPAGIIALVALMFGIEIFFQLFGEEYRIVGIYYFGFWLEQIESNELRLFIIQPVLMFVSHALIHGGFYHMILNAVVLLALGKHLSKQIGSIRAVGLFFVSVAAGAGCFAFLTVSAFPMIGASGGVFGFLGFWKSQEFRQRKRLGMKSFSFFYFILVLIILHVLLHFLLQGFLAWQSHLGGFLAGCIYSQIKSLRVNF